MRLSIVIVNYNVRHFLDQCLHSIYHSVLHDVALDVWVVDNHSTDSSVAMVKERYPQVQLIANRENRGFSQANNQALRKILDNSSQKSPEEQADDYILILNPDTLLEEDTLQRCLDHLQAHPECGALGVKMVNAEGTFLRESKRGFPSPKVSFYKIIGLAHLFPHHPRYGAYYMGQLDDDTVGAVDILPGAFIMTRATVLQKVGLFDESYFMYAEDVDLSWRIHQAGYDNIYFPEARILHYKGECTRKETLSYVYTFYNAMAIFTRHYFGGKGISVRSALLQASIWLRALMAWLKRILSRLVLPVADIVCSWAGFVAIKNIWATCWASNINYYPDNYTWFVLPLYSVILMLSVYLNGGYDKPIRPLKIAQGVVIGALALLVFYSLLDESMRYSRAIVLLGSMWTFISLFALRFLLSLTHTAGFNRYYQRHRRYLIVGKEEEQHRVFNLIGNLGIAPRSVITAQESIDRISQKVDEVVFCAKDIPLKRILDDTQAYRRLHGRHTSFRIVPEADDVLLGSNYTQCPEQLYQDHFDHIDSQQSRRNKRLFDFMSATLLLILSPLIIWWEHNKRTYLAHCWNVLTGRCTWVAYSNTENQSPTLPPLRIGILKTSDRLPTVKQPDTSLLDRAYAQHYRIATDFTILILNIRSL